VAATHFRDREHGQLRISILSGADGGFLYGKVKGWKFNVLALPFQW
jgi:hypothetical protein